MLKPAIMYKDQLESLQYQLYFEDKYKYWNCSVYYEPLNIDPSTWSIHQFVSVLDGEVLGFISYQISRSEDAIYNLNIVNFSDHKATFGRDVVQALKDIFEKYGFRKINFEVVIGNPIERSYDKMIKKYGGRIIGIKKEDVRLVDGKYYDRKMYEVLASEYFEAIKK